MRRDLQNITKEQVIFGLYKLVYIAIGSGLAVLLMMLFGIDIEKHTFIIALAGLGTWAMKQDELKEQAEKEDRKDETSRESSLQNSNNLFINKEKNDGNRL